MAGGTAGFGLIQLDTVSIALEVEREGAPLPGGSDVLVLFDYDNSSFVLVINS